MGFKSIMNGLLNNYSQMPIEEAKKEAEPYLMEGEEVKQGFKLIRDMLFFTDLRVIMFDKQGMKGSKMRVVSIYLSSIVAVSSETAGAFDDAELDLTYIVTPNLKSPRVEYATKKLEFPKNFDVASLYKEFQTLAYENYKYINGLE